MNYTATTCAKNKMAEPTDQLLDKMQALIGRHRDAPVIPSAGSEADAPVSRQDVREENSFPVLTDIVRRGENPVDAVPVPAPVILPEIPQISGVGASDIPSAWANAEQAEQLATAVATHVLGMLDGHLEYAVNTVIAQRLRRVVDDTMSTLLTELAFDLETIVREAVTDELARHGIRAVNATEKSSSPV